MSFWQALLAEATEDLTGLLLVGLLITSLLAKGDRIPKRRVFGIAAFCLLHVALLPLVAWLRANGSDNYRDVRLAALVLAGLAGVNMSGLLLFHVALPRMRAALPKIVQDVIVGVASILVLFGIAARAGYNLSGLVTTSAVLTAVIGLALQETLGSIAGGLALQSDDSIRVGDWVTIGDGTEGRVTEIRWRYTALETRDWETLIIPNTRVVREQVRILGRRNAESPAHRRWLRFNVDFRYTPTDVVAAVQAALRASPVGQMERNPEPDCILEELTESYARYAVRYYLVDPLQAPIVDSDVLTRVLYGLRRAAIPVSIPAHALFLTSDTERRRVEVLRHIDLLATMADDELEHLADQLDALVYDVGEYLTREGEPGDCLYVLVRGSVSVRVNTPGGELEVARVHAGEFVGEGAVLTGEPRTASTVALEQVEGYRLSHDAFERVVRARPEIADHLAHVLSERQDQLLRARAEVNAATRAGERMSDVDLLDKLKGFFKLQTRSSPRPPPADRAREPRETPETTDPERSDSD